MKNLQIILALLLISLCFACGAQKESNLKIVSGENVYYYNVQEAITPEETAKGLMFVEQMPEDEGMIFDLSGQTQIVMWMKNTLIPLDMLFMNENGEIVWIKENATPLSEEYIFAEGNPSYVLELNAGQVQKNNIKIGDKIIHHYFQN